MAGAAPYHRQRRIAGSGWRRAAMRHRASCCVLALLLALAPARGDKLTTAITIRADAPRPIIPRKLDASFWLGPLSINGLAPNTTEPQCAHMGFAPLRALAASAWALCSPAATPQAAQTSALGGAGSASSSVTCYDDNSSRAPQTFCVSRNLVVDSRGLMGGPRRGAGPQLSWPPPPASPRWGAAHAAAPGCPCALLFAGAAAGAGR
jgi:hypothetical protein